MQQWTLSELRYFSAGHAARQRDRDAMALTIAGAAQSAEGFKHLMAQLTKPAL